MAGNGFQWLLTAEEAKSVKIQPISTGDTLLFKMSFRGVELILRTIPTIRIIDTKEDSCHQ